jgi:hypothetical protein
MMRLANDTPVEVAEAHMTEAFGECIGITGSWGPPDRSWYYTSEHGSVFIYRDRRDAQLFWIIAGLMPPEQGDGGVQFIRDCITDAFARGAAEVRAYIKKSNSVSLNYCKKRLPGGAVLTEDTEAWVYAWKAEQWPAK